VPSPNTTSDFYASASRPNRIVNVGIDRAEQFAPVMIWPHSLLEFCINTV